MRMEVTLQPPLKRKRGRPKKVPRKIDHRPIVTLFPKPIKVSPIPFASKIAIQKLDKKSNLPVKVTISPTLSGIPVVKETHLLKRNDGHNNDKNKCKSPVKQPKDRDVHALGEKRRKAKINQWIYKLGDLICKVPSGHRITSTISIRPLWMDGPLTIQCSISNLESKNLILEEAFHYVKSTKSTEKAHLIQGEPIQEITLRVQYLESIICLLVDLLKKHSIPIPTCVYSRNPPSTSSVKNTTFQTLTKPNTLMIPLSTTEVQSPLILLSRPLINQTAPQVTNITVKNSIANSICFIQQPIDSLPLDVPIVANRPTVSTVSSITSSIVSITTNSCLPNNSSTTRETDSNIPVTSCPHNGHQQAHLIKTSASFSHISPKDFKRSLSTGSNIDLKSCELWRPVKSMTPSLTTNVTFNPAHNITMSEPKLNPDLKRCDSLSTKKLKHIITTPSTPVVFSSDTQAVTTSSSSTGLPTTCVNLPERSVVNSSTFDLKASVTLANLASKTALTVLSRKNLISPVQTFGIDNILINTNLQTVQMDSQTQMPSSISSHLAFTTSSIVSQSSLSDPMLTKTNGLCTANTNQAISEPAVIKSNTTKRPRISSSGHTVAALLDSPTGNSNSNTSSSHSTRTISGNNTTWKEPVLGTVPMSTFSDVNAHGKISSATPALTLSQESVQTSLAVSGGAPVSSLKNSIDGKAQPNPNVSKRWENVIANAQSNDMLLTSFMIRNKNSKRRKTVPKKKNLRPRYPTKINDKVLCEGVTSSKINDSIVSSVISTSSSPCFNPSPALKSSIATPVTTQSVILPKTSVDSRCSLANAVHQQVSTKDNCVAGKEISAPKTTNNLNIAASCATTEKLSTSRVVSNWPFTATCSGKQNSSIVTTTASSSSLPVIRTMNDRTVKNKWLEMEKKQEMTIVTNLSDIAQEQCASPVISYQNTKRKRTDSNGTGNLTDPKRMIQVRSCERNIKSTLVNSQTSSTFSAESLCQSDGRKDVTKTLKIKKNQTTKLTKNLSNMSSTSKNMKSNEPNQEQGQHQRQQKRQQQQQEKQKHLTHAAVASTPTQLQQSSQQNLQQKEYQKSDQCSNIQSPPSHQQATTHQQQINMRKLNHQPNLSTYPTTLPTILNIFAPAPVPSSNIQQTNMQSGNFSTQTLVNNNCQQLNMITNNMAESGYNDNMLMAATNFTNFSADTLISENESNITYAVDNMLAQNQTNQVANYWNQTWLPHDMTYNESMFQMNNIQNNNLRNRPQLSSTECSPIKSIMSILQSPSHNTTNISQIDHNQLANLPNNIMQDRFRQKRDFQTLHNQQQTASWNPNNNKSPSNNNMSTSKMNIGQNNLLMNFSGFQPHETTTNKPLPPFHQVSQHSVRSNTNQLIPYPFQQQQQQQQQQSTIPIGYSSLHTTNTQFQMNKTNLRANKNKHGPTFGNYSLINTT